MCFEECANIFGTSKINPFRTKFMLSLHAAADARGFHFTEVYKIGACTINLSSRTKFFLRLNTSVFMNMCAHDLSLEATISISLKLIFVKSFNIFTKKFPEIVAFVVY